MRRGPTARTLGYLAEAIRYYRLGCSRTDACRSSFGYDTHELARAAFDEIDAERALEPVDPRPWREVLFERAYRLALIGARRQVWATGWLGEQMIPEDIAADAALYVMSDAKRYRDAPDAHLVNRGKWAALDLLRAICGQTVGDWCKPPAVAWRTDRRAMPLSEPFGRDESAVEASTMAVAGSGWIASLQMGMSTNEPPWPSSVDRELHAGVASRLAAVSKGGSRAGKWPGLLASLIARRWRRCRRERRGSDNRRSFSRLLRAWRRQKSSPSTPPQR